MKRQVCFWMIAVVALFALSSIAVAETVIADFTAGETDQEVDGFVGMAGDGWYGPWLTRGNSWIPTTTLYTPTTGGYNPLDGGAGNYLGVESIPSGSKGKGGAIGRNFSDGIDATKDHDIDLLVRIDEDLSSSGAFSSIYDQYLIVDNADKVDSLDVSTSSNTTWAIGLFGDRTNEANAGGKWFFHNYVAGVGQHRVTDMVVETGTTYSFHIAVHPDTKTYDVTVDNGTTSVTETGMGWRCTTKDASGLIQFICRGDGPSETRAFSLDSLHISQVPEPGMLVLLATALPIWLGTRRKRG